MMVFGVDTSPRPDVLMDASTLTTSLTHARAGMAVSSIPSLILCRPGRFRPGVSCPESPGCADLDL